ncbi:MAG: hypothetical protein SCARUB_00298 [Candidatus Scalindua rubra]|uniref:Uncharacterized protein n=1 Tax=Candidatus Scalindua rubra TaxID=1872076 RepID=A0A1E3XG08_9BACT|nr:MAG: hypothetical protein SCARUB_00298 [Candidatus Scalindua rubra]
MRYCIGGIAALSVVVGYVIDQFYLSRRNVFLKNIIMVFLCMPFIVNLYQLCRVNVPKINVALKRVSRDDYLEKQYRDLFLMEKYVNKELPEDAVIFAPWENSSYRFDKQFLTGNHIVKAMLEIRSPGEWVNVLKGTYKVDYLLLNRNYHEILIKRYENGSLGYDPCNNILFSKKMKKYLKHVYSSGKCSLYKLP